MLEVRRWSLCCIHSLTLLPVSTCNTVHAQIKTDGMSSKCPSQDCFPSLTPCTEGSTGQLLRWNHSLVYSKHSCHTWISFKAHTKWMVLEQHLSHATNTHIEQQFEFNLSTSHKNAWDLRPCSVGHSYTCRQCNVSTQWYPARYLSWVENDMEVIRRRE